MTWLDAVSAYRHITPEQLSQCMRGCPDPVVWALAFDDAIEYHDIRKRDIPMLLAQVGHESADLTRLEENMNYSAKRLMQVWPNRFPNRRIADRYERDPEMLANEVYGGRMGNDKDGDGWRFRGRGPIQLTGRYNYRRFADSMDSREPIDQPDCLLEPEMGAMAACWFYANHVPVGADIETATRRINGGTHGMADRKQRYDICLSAFKA